LAAWGSKVSGSVALAQRSTFSAPAGVAAPAARTIIVAPMVARKRFVIIAFHRK
jgi:hypothetical protein